jgi:hypothetical protein
MSYTFTILKKKKKNTKKNNFEVPFKNPGVYYRKMSVIKKTQ